MGAMQYLANTNTVRTVYAATIALALTAAAGNANAIQGGGGGRRTLELGSRVDTTTQTYKPNPAADEYIKHIQQNSTPVNDSSLDYFSQTQTIDDTLLEDRIAKTDDEDMNTELTFKDLSTPDQIMLYGLVGAAVLSTLAMMAIPMYYMFKDTQEERSSRSKQGPSRYSTRSDPYRRREEDSGAMPLGFSSSWNITTKPEEPQTPEEPDEESASSLHRLMSYFRTDQEETATPSVSYSPVAIEDPVAAKKRKAKNKRRKRRKKKNKRK